MQHNLSKRSRSLACLGLAGLLGLAGCDKGGSGEQAAKDEAGAAEAGADKSGGDGAKQGTVSNAEVKTFLDDQKKKGCEMLTPALVAKVFEVPEAELQQMKIAGCIYGWKNADESQVVEASITTIIVHDDVAKAQQWFENSTKDQSAEEMRAQLAMVMDKTKEQESVDTKAKEKTVDDVGGVIGAMIPDAGYKYEDVAGVGDAARVLTHDGKLTVRVGNMSFTVGAYKGPAAPPMDPSLIRGDMKAMMAAAREAEMKWLEQTREVRKQQSAELAKAIVAAL